MAICHLANGGRIGNDSIELDLPPSGQGHTGILYFSQAS